MPDLDEQLRRYFDATAPAIDPETAARGAEDRTREIALVESSTRRGWRAVPLAIAAVSIMIVGIGGFLALRDGTPEDEAIKDDAAEPSPRPSGVRGDTLQWERGRVPDDQTGFVQLLTDGKRFYWIGDRIYSSLDGTTWDEVEFADGVSTPLLEDRPADAASAGQIIWSDRSSGYSPGQDQATMTVEIVGIDGSVRVSELTLTVDEADVTTMIAELQNGVTTIGPRGALATARLSVQDYAPLLHDVLGAELNSVVSIRLDLRVPGTTLLVELPDRTERIVLADHGASTRSVEVAPTRVIGWHSTDGVAWTEIPAVGPFAVGAEPQSSLTATTSGFVSLGGQGWFSSDGLAWSGLDGPLGEPCCEPPIAWGPRAVYSGTLGGIVAADESGFATLPGSDAEDRAISRGGLGAGEVGIGYLTDIERTPGSPSLGEVALGEVALDIVYSPDGTSWRRQPLPDEIGDLYSVFDHYGIVGGVDAIAVLAENDTGLELWLGSPTEGDGS